MGRSSVSRTAVLLTLCLLAISSLALMQAPSASLFQSANYEVTKALQAVGQNNQLLTILLTLFGIWAIAAALATRETEQPSEAISGREQVLALSHKWADPQVLYDGAAMKRILHNRFVFIDGDNTMDRSAFLRGIQSLRIDSQILNHDVVRVEGNTAVVEGTGRIIYRFPDAQAPLAYRFSTVYRKQDGEWKAISQQIDRLADAAREPNQPMHSAA